MKKGDIEIAGINISIMVKQYHVEKFNGRLSDFMAFIKKYNPEDRSQINVNLHKYKDSDKAKYLDSVLRRMEPHIDIIIRADEFLFSPEYSKNPRIFMVNYDLMRFWKKNPNARAKAIVFRYLQMLYVHASLALDKNIEKVKMIAEVIKVENELAVEAVNNPNAFDEADGITGGLDLKSIFGDDNILMDIAKDITETVDIKELLSDVMKNGNFSMNNPMEMANKLAKNPKMMETLKNLQSTVGNKLKDKNLTNDDVMKSMDNIKNNLSKNLKNMPGGTHIKKMLNNMNIEQMLQNFMPPQSANATANATMIDNKTENMNELFSNVMNNPMMSEMLKTMTNENLKFDEIDVAIETENIDIGIDEKVKVENKKVEIAKVEVEDEKVEDEKVEADPNMELD